MSLSPLPITTTRVTTEETRGTESTFKRKYANSYDGLKRYPHFLERKSAVDDERGGIRFSKAVFVNSDGEAASVRRVAPFGQFRHFVSKRIRSLSLSLSFIPFSFTPSPSFSLLIIFNLSPLLLYHSNSLSLIFVFIDKRNSFVLLS